MDAPALGVAEVAAAGCEAGCPLHSISFCPAARKTVDAVLAMRFHIFLFPNTYKSEVPELAGALVLMPRLIVGLDAEVPKLKAMFAGPFNSGVGSGWKLFNGGTET